MERLLPFHEDWYFLINNTDTMSDFKNMFSNKTYRKNILSI